MKQTNRVSIIKSPANIAFIKYWGRSSTKDILPLTDTFSMNLSNCYTIVRLEVVDDSGVQELFIKDYKAETHKQDTGTALLKVQQYYARAKKYLGVTKNFGFRIYSENSFPKKAGIASSASFFSAQALAFATLFEKKLPEKQLSILSRLSGSGSAARSVCDGFVVWKKGANSTNSYAQSIAPATYWKLVDLVLILTYQEKKAGSGEGHEGAHTSPFLSCRISSTKKRIRHMLDTFKTKDFVTFGRLIEEDAVSMHAVMMTQSPPLYYWSGATMEVIKKTLALREQGIEAYFTIDAGENVHIICEKKNEKKVFSYFSKLKEVQEIISNDPAVGTRLIG